MRSAIPGIFFISTGLRYFPKFCATITESLSPSKAPELLAWRNRLTAEHQGLFVCGFGWDGIGINDMIKTARRVAEAVMAGNRDQERESPIKKVYF